ncbi:unnamed protein product [Caenorhabditis bovis]|uniref:ER membrane protein complex subunit 10 n=1 Tax=Caenorhabditis bovis TaxID=2654633 RepID=A0A8S1EHN4_9PELO|nr:unnamed protein product [Caenorhabditis bovis]
MILKSILLFGCILPSIFAGEWTIEMEYSFDDFATSSKLGIIELRRHYDGNYTNTLKVLADDSFGKKIYEARDKTYTVRARSSTQPGEEFLSTNDPCLFLQSNLFHLFWVSINQHAEKLQSLTVFPDSVAFKTSDISLQSFNPKATCDERTVGIEPSLENRIGDGKLKGVVHVNSRSILPHPDTAAFVARIEKEKKARQHGADADNRSFLAKYWMYIVPVVIFAFISNAVNPENAEGGGGGRAQ